MLCTYEHVSYLVSSYNCILFCIVYVHIDNAYIYIYVCVVIMYICTYVCYNHVYTHIYIHT